MDFQWVTTVSWECSSHCLSLIFFCLYLFTSWVTFDLLSIHVPAFSCTPTYTFPSVLPYVFLWIILPLKHSHTFSHLSFTHTQGCIQRKGSCLFLYFSEDNEYAASFMIFWQLLKSHKTHYRNNHPLEFQPLSFTVTTVLTALNGCTLAPGLFICPLANCKDSAVADHDWFWCDAALYGWRRWSVKLSSSQ